MIQRKILLTILVAIFLAFTPSVVLADGGNPPPPGDYKYAPPPYIGNVTVTYNPNICYTDQWDNPYAGCAYLDGALKRAGSTDTVVVLPGVLFAFGIQLIDFQSHTAQDLQGRQILGSALQLPGIYEIIAAHSLFYNVDKTLFTVDLIIMEIVSK